MKLYIAVAMLCLSLIAQANDQEKPLLSKNLSDDGFLRLQYEQGYVPAKIIKYARPVYPFNQAKRARAGIVEVEFIVDKDGKTDNIFVKLSTDENFERPAINAVKNYTYEAATLNGKPVLSRVEIQIHFRMSKDRDRAGLWFVKNYELALKELNSDDPDSNKVQKLIDKMKSAEYLSVYALSHYFLLKSKFAIQFLSKHEQLEANQKRLT